MSLLQKKINSQQSEKQYISKKIENENIKPTETEQKTAKDIIKELSEKYSEELIKKGKDEIEDELASTIVQMCSKLDISFEEQKRIEKTVLMTVLGHGPIEVFLQDPKVSEIIVQHYDNVVVEKNGKLESTDVTFNNEEHLQTIIKRIVQRADRQVNISSPIVDTRLEDGSRVNAVLPPVSVDGATLDSVNSQNRLCQEQIMFALVHLTEKCCIFWNAVFGEESIFLFREGQVLERQHCLICFPALFPKTNLSLR